MKIYQQLCLIAKIFLLALCTTTINAETPAPVEFDDWIVSNSCSQTINQLCHGYYKQYPFSNIESDGKQPITVTSDEAKFIAKTSSSFQGNVVASQGDNVLFADKATATHDTNSGDVETITATGHVKIMHPGVRVDGTQAVSYIKEDNKKIDNAVYRIYDRHALGQADQLIVLGRDRMYLTQSTYTTCAPGSNAWYLKASETKFNKETGRGEAWHARMYVKDTPVFYWPYVNFPIDKRRQTGFLQPSFASSSLNGKTVIFPFYWNMAPNYDSTITTSYMSQRSFKFNNVFRYLTHTSSGTANFDFLPEDRAYASLRDGWLANPSFVNSTNTQTILRKNDLRSSDFRYRYALKNTSRFYKQFLFTVDYTDASDGDYLYDFRNESSNYVTNTYSTEYARQMAALQYSSQIGRISYQLERFKTFYAVQADGGTEQLSKLPAIDFNSIIFNLPNNFNFLINATYYQFRPRLIKDNNVQLSYGHRSQARPAIFYSKIEPGWFIKPRAQLNLLYYSDLNIIPQQVANGVRPFSASRTIPMFDVDSGLIFERNMQFRQRSYIQTLEPRLYYLYVPSKNQNYLPQFDTGTMTFDYNLAFRDNIYTGLDRVAPANQFGLGLASKFFRNDNGEEIGMVGVSEIVYLRDENFIINGTDSVKISNQHLSPLAFIAQARIAPAYTLTGYLTRGRSATENASLQLQYRPDPSKVVNFGYAYVRDPSLNNLNGTQNSTLNQVSASAAWQMLAPWRVLGKYSYDLRNSRNLETLAGFEYHTCCTAVRFLWSRTWMTDLYDPRKYNTGFRLQFIFRGFAGVGNADDNYIKTAIPGYTPSS